MVRYTIILFVAFGSGLILGGVVGYEVFMHRAWSQVKSALIAGLSHTIDTNVIEEAFFRLCREFNGGVTDKYHDKVVAKALAWAKTEDERRDPRMVKAMIQELRKRVAL